MDLVQLFILIEFQMSLSFLPFLRIRINVMRINKTFSDFRENGSVRTITTISLCVKTFWKIVSRKYEIVCSFISQCGNYGIFLLRRGVLTKLS